MQKGFIFPSLYIYLGFTVAMLIILAMLKIQTSRLDSCKAEYQSFKSEIDRLAKEQELSNKVKKQKADDELKKLKSVNDTLSKRVRDNASTSFVQPSTVTGESKTACYDSEKLDGAIKRFADRVTGITEQGQNAITDLNVSKNWAQQN